MMTAPAHDLGVTGAHSDLQFFCCCFSVMLVFYIIIIKALPSG